MKAPRVTHNLTLDVESSGRAAGDQGPPDLALRSALADLLELLDCRRVRATFFVLARDLDGLAPVLQQAVQSGHEVGSHGLEHHRADGLTPMAFRAELRESRHRIEDVTQRPCVSYRAPWFSAPPPVEAGWFFEAMAVEGFRFDYSLRLPLAEAAVYRSPTPGVGERPVPIVSWGCGTIGVLGGLSLRVLPKMMVRSLVRRVSRSGVSACVYLHPYEWYRPAVTGHGLRRRLGLARTLTRLDWLLAEEAFESLSREEVCM